MTSPPSPPRLPFRASCSPFAWIPSPSLEAGRPSAKSSSILLASAWPPSMATTFCWCASTARPSSPPCLKCPLAVWNPASPPKTPFSANFRKKSATPPTLSNTSRASTCPPGSVPKKMHAFLATDLRPAVLDPDYDEDIQVVRVPVAEIPALLQSGQVRDAKTITTLLLTLQALQNPHPPLSRT